MRGAGREDEVEVQVEVQVEGLYGRWWMSCLLLRVCSGVLRTKFAMVVARRGNRW